MLNAWDPGCSGRVDPHVRRTATCCASLGPGPPAPPTHPDPPKKTQIKGKVKRPTRPDDTERNTQVQLLQDEIMKYINRCVLQQSVVSWQSTGLHARRTNEGGASAARPDQPTHLTICNAPPTQQPSQAEADQGPAGQQAQRQGRDARAAEAA